MGCETWQHFYSSRIIHRLSIHYIRRGKNRISTLKPRRDVTRNPKQGYQCPPPPPKKGLVSANFFFKKFQKNNSSTKIDSPPMRWEKLNQVWEPYGILGSITHWWPSQRTLSKTWQSAWFWNESICLNYLCVYNLGSPVATAVIKVYESICQNIKLYSKVKAALQIQDICKALCRYFFFSTHTHSQVYTILVLLVPL